MAQCRRLIGPAVERDAGARRLYVAALAGVVLGVAPVNDLGGAESGWVLGLIRVRQAARGMGLGERIITRAVDDARRAGAPALSLVTSEDNVQMRTLASKLGFAPVVLPGRARRHDGPGPAQGTDDSRVFLRKALT